MPRREVRLLNPQINTDWGFLSGLTQIFGVIHRLTQIGIFKWINTDFGLRMSICENLWIIILGTD